MKLNIVKESFGPYRVTCTQELDMKDKDAVKEMLEDGALYRLERTPSTTAEKPYWPYVNKKGEPSRVGGKDDPKWTRADIPVSEPVRKAIQASYEASGYQDVVVEVREAKDAGGPAWKRNVAALVSMIEIDPEMTQEAVERKVALIIQKLNLDHVEVAAYLKACLAKV